MSHCTSVHNAEEPEKQQTNYIVQDEKLSAITLSSYTTQFVDKQSFINPVIKKHTTWGKCRPTAFGASSKNQFIKHEFKKKNILYNRIRVTGSNNRVRGS